MSLYFLNSEEAPYGSDTFRSYHDGHIGSAYHQIIYVRNDDPSLYYSNVELTPVFSDDSGESFSTTNWSIKLLYGSRRPTEHEWSLQENGGSLSLPDIGSYEAADTTTNHPVWVRIYCPGNQSAQIKRTLSLKISYDERLVGVE